MNKLKKTTRFFIICMVVILFYNMFLIDIQGTEATLRWNLYRCTSSGAGDINEYKCNSDNFYAAGVCSCLWGWRKDVPGMPSEYWNCATSQT